MFFNQIQSAPADPILGLTEAFRQRLLVNRMAG